MPTNFAVSDASGKIIQTFYVDVDNAPVPLDAPAGTFVVVDADPRWAAYKLGEAKQEKLASLAAEYEARIEAGRSYTIEGQTTARVYQIDEVPTAARPSSQSVITAAGAWAANILRQTPGTAPWPANFAWRAADNVLVPMTAEQMYAFSQDIALYTQGVKAAVFGLQGQIASATDQASLAAIDITSGWPA